MSDSVHKRTKDHVPGLTEESQKAEEQMKRAGVAGDIPSAADAGSAILSVKLPADLKERLDRAVEDGPAEDASEVVRTALEQYLSEG